MTALALLVVIIAIVLGIVGAVVKGLFYLLVIGVVLFIIDVLVFGMHLGRGRGSKPTR